MEELIEKRLLNLKSASIYLDTSPGSLYKMIDRKKIPEHCVVRIGERIFLDKKRLDVWINQQGKPKWRFW